MAFGILCGVVVLLFASMAVQGWLSHRPPALGLQNGRLRNCPASPNCVSSDAPPGEHFVAPLAKPPGETAPLAAVQAVIESTPRARVVALNDGYLRAEFESLIFRFVDDLEVQWRPERQELAVRSASRVGYWDLGVNRRRVERLRQQLR